MLALLPCLTSPHTAYVLTVVADSIPCTSECQCVLPKNKSIIITPVHLQICPCSEMLPQWQNFEVQGCLLHWLKWEKVMQSSVPCVCTGPKWGQHKQLSNNVFRGGDLGGRRWVRELLYGTRKGKPYQVSDGSWLLPVRRPRSAPVLTPVIVLGSVWCYKGMVVSTELYRCLVTGPCCTISLASH